MFHFKPVDDRSLVHRWLAKPYITKWFYGQGLENTKRGLDAFLNGVSDTQYWFGFERERPFAFLITSYADPETITLDMLIGEEDYLGKGFAVPLIEQFLDSQFPDIVNVVIDPEKSNAKAVHVYQKAGFSIEREFVPSHSPHPHFLMRMDLRKKRLLKYLYEQIPLSEAMGITIDEASPDRVVMKAPFLPNINHKQTVFGGSLHAVATLACWSLLYLNMKCQIVITKSEVAFQAPVKGDFTAICQKPDAATWSRFMKTLQRGRARIALVAQIIDGGRLAVDFRGEFAAIQSPK